MDALITAYLRRLDVAAASLPQERRAELEAEVREHIDTALSEDGIRDEVTIRNVLERLGSPEEIVAAEAAGTKSDRGTIGPVSTRASAAQPNALSPSGKSLGAIEIIALLLLTVGSILLPFIGPIIGLVFVWLSDRWNASEKVIATAIVAVLLVLPLALFLGASANAGLNGPQLVPPQTVGP
jgi:uncharacterized membrane protein